MEDDGRAVDHDGESAVKLPVFNAHGIHSREDLLRCRRRSVRSRMQFQVSSARAGRVLSAHIATYGAPTILWASLAAAQALALCPSRRKFAQLLGKHYGVRVNLSIKALSDKSDCSLRDLFFLNDPGLNSTQSRRSWYLEGFNFTVKTSPGDLNRRHHESCSIDRPMPCHTVCRPCLRSADVGRPGLQRLPADQPFPGECDRRLQGQS